MDLRRYAGVLWRFRLLVALGFVFAVTLAALSVVKFGSHGITYRQSRLWTATVRLKVTQLGFPEGRLYAQDQSPTGQVTTPEKGVPVANPDRFNQLAILYAELITSDPVRKLAHYGELPGTVTATPLRDDQSGVLLPLIDISSVSTSARGAMDYADRSAQGLIAYVTDQQRANKVPVSDRAILAPISLPRGADVFRPRPKTMPIVVFLAVMFATIGLAFILENARPRRRTMLEPETATVERPAQRRSA